MKSNSAADISGHSISFMKLPLALNRREISANFCTIAGKSDAKDFEYFRQKWDFFPK